MRQAIRSKDYAQPADPRLEGIYSQGFKIDIMQLSRHERKFAGWMKYLYDEAKRISLKCPVWIYEDSFGGIGLIRKANPKEIVFQSRETAFSQIVPKSFPYASDPSVVKINKYKLIEKWVDGNKTNEV